MFRRGEVFGVNQHSKHHWRGVLGGRRLCIVEGEFKRGASPSFFFFPLPLVKEGGQGDGFLRGTQGDGATTTKQGM